MQDQRCPQLGARIADSYIPPRHSSRVARSNALTSNFEASTPQKTAPDLSPETQLLDQRAVTRNILALQVIEKAPSLAHDVE